MTLLKAGGAAALLSIAFAAAPASADTVGFSYRVDDAALATVDGAERVYQDIYNAAHEACRRGAPSAMRSVNTSCRADLVAVAVSQIDNATLRTIASRETGRTIQVAAR